jgi:hypothetical protein
MERVALPPAPTVKVPTPESELLESERRLLLAAFDWLSVIFPPTVAELLERMREFCEPESPMVMLEATFRVLLLTRKTLEVDDASDAIKMLSETLRLELETTRLLLEVFVEVLVLTSAA